MVAGLWNGQSNALLVGLMLLGASAIFRHRWWTAAIFLGLRLMEGINLENYHARFGRDLCAEFNGELDRLGEAGLIEVDCDVLKLTSRGALLSNEVFAALA